MWENINWGAALTAILLLPLSWDRRTQVLNGDVKVHVTDGKGMGIPHKHFTKLLSSQGVGIFRKSLSLAALSSHLPANTQPL